MGVFAISWPPMIFFVGWFANNIHNFFPLVKVQRVLIDLQIILVFSKINLFQTIEGQTYFSTSWHAK